MNILVLSAGTRNKIVQYFKNAVHNEGKVVATDASSIAPALYEADAHYVVPKISDPNYLDVVLDICEKEKIDGVLSLIDPELSLLAENEKRFQESGVQVIGSTYEACQRAFDKWEMYNWLTDQGYACAKTYIDRGEFEKALRNGELTYPIFVKPRFGSASISISKVYDSDELDVLWKKEKDLIIQEFLDGVEFGADCYVDMKSHEPISIFVKKKIVMRAGETDKAVSYIDKQLFDLLEKMLISSGYLGPIDVDIFLIKNQYYISEINPRFGGGYPHAYECGVDHMKYIVNNLKGEQNSRRIGSYKEGIYMMKYNEIKII